MTLAHCGQLVSESKESGMSESRSLLTAFGKACTESKDLPWCTPRSFLKEALSMPLISAFHVTSGELLILSTSACSEKADTAVSPARVNSLIDMLVKDKVMDVRLLKRSKSKIIHQEKLTNILNLKS